MGKIRYYAGTRQVSVDIDNQEFEIRAHYQGYSDPGRCGCSNDDAYPAEGGDEEDSREYTADGVTCTEAEFKTAILEAMENALEKAQMDEDD